jgi:hypothetical protein
MKILSSCCIIVIAHLIQKSCAYVYSAKYTSRISTSTLPFVSPRFSNTIQKKVSLKMIRTGGLEIREEGATPTGKCTILSHGHSRKNDRHSQ